MAAQPHFPPPPGNPPPYNFQYQSNVSSPPQHGAQAPYQPQNQTQFQNPVPVPAELPTFTIRGSDSETMHITPCFWPSDHPPLYTLSFSKYKKPNITLSRLGPDGASTVIGTSIFHSFSMTTDIKLHNQSFELKPNSMGDSYNISSTSSSSVPNGKLKWKTDSWTGKGTPKSLISADGIKLAEFSSSISGLSSSGLKELLKLKEKERNLEILVPATDNGFFAELAILTALTGWKISKEVNKAVAEALTG